MLKKLIFPSVLALGLCTAPMASQGASIDLPDIGDSSAAAISPEQQHLLGKQMMRSLRQSRAILDDPELNAYIKRLGLSLLASNAFPADQYTFFVVDAATINAFALPGGYIGVHSGLITASRSESELAAVLAHEIAHVSQHHIARSFEKASQLNLPMTAAVIAAILLGQQDPNAGNALLQASIAQGTKTRLDFTRANEKEADRIGIQMLAEAGYSPQAMPSFFRRLKDETRYYTSAPEFLSTHPVTESRISDSLNRAEQYPSRQRANSIQYQLVKARLKVLSSTDPGALRDQLANEIKTAHGADKEAAGYAHALVQSRLMNYAEARTQLRALLKQSPERIAYYRALADLERADNRYPEALAVYREGLRLYPNNAPLTLGYAETLLLADNAETARKALSGYTRQAPQPGPRALQLLAEAETKLGHTFAASLALADYYYAVDELHSAIDQLTRARRDKNIDFYNAERIDARLRQLEEEAAYEQRMENQ